MSDDLVIYLKERLEKMDDKLDTLLAFKWQIVGGSVAFSVLITVLFQIAIFVVKN